MGVSESSVKRWVDDGRLPAERTAGGHRRIRLAHAVRFVRESGMEVVRPDLLRPRPEGTRRRGAGPTPSSLTEALRELDGAAARGMLVGSFLQGASVATLCDGPIRTALHELGPLWKESPTGIALEHHAVDACIQALMEIRAMISVAERSRSAVGGAVEHDPYILPSLMVAVVLAEAGFRTRNLGPNVPASALRAATEAKAPDLVWRSTSIEMDPTALRADIDEIRKGRSLEIVVGGRGLGRGASGTTSGVHHCESMAELAGFARGMQRTAGRSGRR
ncbi:MAG: hypothetical protein FJ144_02805 [Deltaproteobacteria bacterium]|nr:hypothetical protein [Deltaproteobacteria bacterium]